MKNAVLHQESLVRAGLKPVLVVRTLQKDHRGETYREDEGGFLRHLYLQNGRSSANLVNLWLAQHGNRIALLVVKPTGGSVLQGLMFVLIADSQGILKEIVLNQRKEEKQNRELYRRQ